MLGRLLMRDVIEVNSDDVITYDSLLHALSKTRHLDKQDKCVGQKN